MTFTKRHANSRSWRANPKPLSVTAVSLGPEVAHSVLPMPVSVASYTPFAVPDGKEATRRGLRGGAAAGAGGSSDDAESRRQPAVTDKGA